MKKLAVALSIAFAVSGFFGMPQKAHAETPQFSVAGGEYESCMAAAGSDTAKQANCDKAYGQHIQNLPGNAAPSTGCASWTGINLSECVGDLVLVILKLVKWILFFFLWLAALFLDTAIANFVVGMGGYITGPGAGGIQSAWTVVRDLANIGIIGGLIAVGIGTILQSATYSANKLLARLLIAALLVNFSYFFAGAVIDASNYIATQIYGTMITSSVTAIGGTPCTLDTCTLSSTFMTATNFQKIDDTLLSTNGSTQLQSDANTAARNGGGTQSPAAPSSTSAWFDAWVELLSIVLECVATFVFLSALGLFIGRFVALVFVLITSPIGIAGSAIPGVSKYAKEWWDILFGQAFFAPVYLLLVFLSFKAMAGFHSALAATGGDGQIITTLLSFIAVTAFMLMSLRVAKQMSETGKQYLGDIYKGAGQLTGWMPNLYKYGLQTVGTQTVGRGGDALQRRYEKWMSQAPEHGFSLRGLVAGTAIDRNLQKGLQSIGNAKFGGKEGFVDTLHAKETRGARLSEVKKFKDAQDKKPGLDKQKEEAQERYEALRKEYGEVDTKGKKGKRASLEDKIALDKFQKRFSDLSDKEKEAVMEEQEWKDAFADLRALAEDLAKKEKGGKKWEDMSDEERAKFTERMAKENKWKGRLWVKDKSKGTYGWETGFPYYDRLRRSIDLRNDEEKNALAKEKFKKDYSQLNDQEKSEIGKLTLQGSIDDLRTPLNEVSWDLIKEEQLRNNHTVKDLTSMLSSEQYLAALKDKSISKKERNEMREERLGEVMEEAQNFEDNVVELGAWEKMSNAERAGKVLRGSAEYDAYRWALHETLKKNVPGDELVDFVEADTGTEKGHHKGSVRQNRVLNDAVTNGVYRKLQDSAKISSGEKRSMRGLKRTRYENAISEDTAAQTLFDDIQEERAQGTFNKKYAELSTEERKQVQLTEEDRDKAGQDDFAMERYGKKYAELSKSEQQQIDSKALSYEEFEKVYNEKGGEGSQEGRLFRAAWLRKRAETSAENYFGGKNPTEVASEVKQESFGTRIAGKSMRRDQLLASREAKDQAWQDLQAHAMAVYGSPEEVNWLMNSSDGQNYRVDWDQVNRDRDAAGLDTVQQVLSGRESAMNTQRERTVTDIARENSEAVGNEERPEPEPTPVSRIQTVIRQRAGEAPAGTDENAAEENIDALTNELPTQDAAELIAETPVNYLENPAIAQDIVRGFDEHHLEAIWSDGRLTRRKRDAIISALIGAAGPGGKGVHPSSIVWLKNLYERNVLSPEQRTAYEQIAGPLGI